MVIDNILFTAERYLIPALILLSIAFLIIVILVRPSSFVWFNDHVRTNALLRFLSYPIFRFAGMNKIPKDIDDITKGIRKGFINSILCFVACVIVVMVLVNIF